MDYLSRVLSALNAQTFARDQWELILVDNRSEPPLVGRVNQDNFPHGELVREEIPGLVAARIRGLREAIGKWIVYVDDDNILQQDYLEALHQLTVSHPNVAVWSGSIQPEFEVLPSVRTKPYWKYLAVREVERTLWSNLPLGEILPCGAGMAVRRDVMENWTEGLKTHTARTGLGRKENSLLAGEDTDIGLTACDMGLGVGLAKTMQLTHLIPARRVEPAYLRKLAYAVTYSHTLLDLLRRRVSNRALIMRSLWFTRELLQNNRTGAGIALWWCQITGVFSAWRYFRQQVQRTGSR